MTTRDEDGMAVYKIGNPAVRYRAEDIVCVFVDGRCEVREKKTHKVVDRVTRPMPEVDVLDLVNGG